MSVSYIDRQTLAAIAPTVEKALSISLEQYGWALSAFSLAYLVVAPLAGTLLDRAGARRGLVFAVAIWSAVAAIHAVVPSFALLLALRIALGTAEAPSFPGAAQTMKRILPPGERSKGIGLLFTGSSLGAMVAGPLAIRIVDLTGAWRSAFVGTALLGILWIPLWLFVTSRAGVREALATREADEADSPPRANDAPPRRPLLAHAAVWRAGMLVVFVAPSIMFGLNWTPNYLAGTFKLDQSALAHYIWLPPLGFDLGAVVFGTLASRADRRSFAAGTGVKSHLVLVAAAALLSATMIAMPLVHGPWLATIVLTISLAGGGATFALLTADMLARVPPALTAGAAGMTAAAQSLAYIVANPLVGRVVDEAHSYERVLLVLGAIVLPAAALWAAWPMPVVGQAATGALRPSREA